MQTQGFMLAHNRPIIKGANKNSEDLAAENNWWADAGTWGNGTGYRRGASALDAKPFLVAMAHAFCQSALAPGNIGLSNSLRPVPGDGLVQATFEQAAWASFKVRSNTAILQHSVSMQPSIILHRLPDCCAALSCAFNGCDCCSCCFVQYSCVARDTLKPCFLHKVHADQCECACSSSTRWITHKP